VQAALEAGFDEHLTKPPDPERLERLILQHGSAESTALAGPEGAAEGSGS
jgi:CheY-like chemotaxis protein